jgi:hypothetical protein
MLETTSHILGIVASLIAIGGVYYAFREYSSQKKRWQSKREELEAYLKDKKIGNEYEQKTALHLIRHLGLTQDEILKISFESSVIERKIKPDEAGMADRLLFHYEGQNE